MKIMICSFTKFEKSALVTDSLFDAYQIIIRRVLHDMLITTLGEMLDGSGTNQFPQN
ncbi:hypothetical protein VAL01S_07_01470 [Vibrio alginolyticus NBRC 15630 = ATCC 17749]|nr:hypothetical protein YZOS03_40470 [Vibrio alginolyticus]BCG19479.1 hypothetical protein HLBS07_33310 [Vibrio alginolyticus]GAD71350.1 hypothetical protein VAL01S_07_01470 [Vibrio alginolyticus NBRC 15630 = ATCC 17749]